MKEDQGFGGGGSIIRDLFGSVRQSLNFRPKLDSDEFSNATSSVAERIGSCIRKSRVGLGGFLPKSPSRRLTMGIGSVVKEEEEAPLIRWRKGELIGAGAFGQVFMGMNLDSGELLAVKQVVIENSNASKEKAQAHIRELEEEVKLLKNLSHRNIVRYLGIVREENTLNILLEFVPGGSISSLLSKFGSFPETVIRMYTKQILQGLEYLHRNKIIHRDIKGANILVDNKGCIKLADFGASKQVAQLATMAAAKSFKGTAYWMAPEVIVQSGYSFSADIWSVGCTVIEMATGKPPWSGQYQEVAALFHVGTTKSHPPIPEHLSSEAKDFLLKCLQEDACLRPSSYELLQHPFVTGELMKVAQPLSYGSKESTGDVLATNRTHSTNNFGTITNSERRKSATGSVGDMCELDYEDEFPVIDSKSFNRGSEEFEWPSKLDLSPEQKIGNCEDDDDVTENTKEFVFPTEGNCEDDDEVTENNIRAFLDEKALDLKKLQTPLFEEFLNNSSNSTTSQVIITSTRKENITNITNQYQAASCHPINADSKLPPVTPNRIIPSGPTTLFRSGSSRAPAASPNQAGVASRRVSHGIGIGALSPNPAGVASRRVSHVGGSNRVLQEILSPRQMNHELVGQNGALPADQPDPSLPTLTFSRRHEIWKEELVQELDQHREKLGLTTPSRMTSPNDSPLNRKRNRPNNNNKL
ncbi:hypothetical protein LUZ60_017210 [Juncus effusus]|nr:hypothetical protein LUZ60_017210 [Juncus effusus]